MGRLKRVYQDEVEVRKGYRYVGGRPHGFNFEKRYRVIVEFDSQELADTFVLLVDEWNEGKQRDSEHIAPF